MNERQYCSKRKNALAGTFPLRLGNVSTKNYETRSTFDPV